MSLLDITRPDLFSLGKVLKTHGIRGELSLLLDDGLEDLDLTELSALFADIEGLYVPFFVTAERRRSDVSRLVTLRGIDSDRDASALVGKEVFALRTDISEADGDDTEQLFLEDIAGWEAFTEEGKKLGVIAETNTDTPDNPLFVIHSPDGREILIPVADGEFISKIDEAARQITFSLPEGLLDLHN